MKKQRLSRKDEDFFVFDEETRTHEARSSKRVLSTNKLWVFFRCKILF